MTERLASLLHYMGIVRIFRFITKKKKKIKILMYHRIADNSIDILPYYSQLNVSVKSFEEQIIYLKKNYNIIRVEDIENAPENSVIITFDDGYLDNYTNAYPILKKYDVPATIFVAADAIDGKILWINKYYYCLNNISLEELIDYFNIITNADIKLKNKIKSAEEMQHFLMFKLNKKRREIIIEKIIKHFKLKLPIKNYMTWNNLKEMSKNNISIGSHTCSHQLLSTLTAEEIEEELINSKKKIEDNVNKVNAIAYPWGNKKSFNKEVIKTASKYYKYGLTTLPYLNFKNKLLLPRISVPNKNIGVLSAYIELVNIIKFFRK